MLLQRKSWVVVLATLMTVVLFAQPALAAPNLVVSIGGNTVNTNDAKLVSSKTVTLSVYDSNGEAQSVNITVNSKKVAAKSVTGQVYNWQANLSLNTGVNNVTVSANGLNNSTYTVNFQIMYVTTPVPGLTYDVSSLPASGKIEAFNRTVTLTYPRGDVLVDGSGQITNSSVAFTVYDPPTTRPDNYHFLASQVIQISVPQAVYLLQPGQLTLSYDPNISAALADQLAIWYSPDNVWNDNDNYILGGRTDARNHTVTAPFQFNGTTEGYYAVFLADRVFKDFTSQSDAAWAYSSVMPMWAKGLVEPLPIDRTDNNFGAGNNINRLEFTTIIIKGLGLPLIEKTSSVFSDVYATPEGNSSSYFGSNYSSASGFKIYDQSHTPVQYAETAARYGIIAGYPEGTFKPANSLTRQEAAVILARAANLKLLSDGDKAKTDLERIFTDASAIQPWAAPSILAAYRARLIAGLPDGDKKIKFAPNDPLTRAQAITMVYRLLEKQKKI
ncbi:S-layer homology domain-containing protein [Neomoorella thermoacetica]|uniref:S-layer homology domain-containing protein n=1 Tax=Neomoorella thermoacetica TaxID=1525 RepID=UPI000908344D|nr:S-layer homology domain-containing protein [Moorella thermoacetica]APC07867.1 endo-1,4-beta-xylanase A precursor [Moorella thermoacetica]